MTNPSNYTGFVTFEYRFEVCCGNPPAAPSNTSTVDVLLIGDDDAQNAGNSCNVSVGEPVNVTNGNMWIEHNDYDLPGIGEKIEISRFYNSIIQTAGLFGLGWSTKYDESLQIYSDGKMIRLNEPNGRASYFGRSSTSDPFTSYSRNVVAEIVKNTDNTYILTYKDGRTHKFNSGGQLLWQKDREGNQTTLTYSGLGVLIGITDAVGRTLTISTGTNGHVEEISDTVGTVASYEYHTSTNRLKTVTYNDGSKYKFEYTTISGKTYITTVKDALDNILEAHEYDSNGRATTSEKDGGVNKYTIVYGLSDFFLGQYSKVTDGLGRETKYFFSRHYGTNLVTRTDGSCSCGAGGSEVTQYFYDTSNSWLNLKKKTDALGRDTTYTYDAERNVTAITDVLGTQTFTYNSLGQVLTHTDRMSGVTTNTYDSAGNRLTTTDPLNNTTTFTYTTIGQLESIEDARGKTTELTYDSSGRLITVTDANNKDTDFTYNARSRVTSVTNALSETTQFEYDDKDRLDKITHPDTSSINIAYDLAGRRTSVTDENNNETTYAYDGAYRLTGITDALNHTKSFDYDLMSNLTEQTDALGNATSFEYDDFNRLKKIVHPIPTASATPLQETTTYDKLGNLKTRVDTAGRTTSYDYDTANRLTKITDSLSNFTQFEYNARSQMTKVKDALNQEYVFTYDPLGRQLSRTRAGTTMTYEYDPVGNRIARTDHNGAETEYVYDNLNRMTGITYTGSSEYAVYGYDDLSRLTSAENQNGTVSFTYDNRSRLATETDVFAHLLEYTYDPAGRRVEMKIDSNVHATYDYDLANRLTLLNDETNNSFTFAYDNADRLITETSPSGITSSYSYDGMSRLKRLKHELSPTALYDDQFTYNSANQISQIAGLISTKSFTYDNVNRLTGVTSGAGNESYTYDAVGNRTSSHLAANYTYDPFNILASTPTFEWSYDENGSLVFGIPKVGPTDPRPVGTNYSWDREGRLLSAAQGATGVSYTYDALGRRISRTETDTRSFTYDGLDVVMDFDPNASGYSLVTYQNGPGIDNKLKSEFRGTSEYFLKDHLGSTVALTDAGGAVAEANSYDSFGNPSNPSFSSRYQFTGREWDSFSNLQFSRARWYDPGVGRFISEDPIGFAGGDVNLYGYVRNNPISMVDPTGLFPGNPIIPVLPYGPVIRNSAIVKSLIGDGGYFSPETLSELISATERSKITCNTSWTQRWWYNFKTTNSAIPGMASPAIIPGIGVGAFTSSSMATELGTMTALRWALNGFRGASLAGVAGATAANVGANAAAFEVGVAAGSAVNATFAFGDYCACNQ